MIAVLVTLMATFHFKVRNYERDKDVNQKNNSLPKCQNVGMLLPRNRKVKMDDTKEKRGIRMLVLQRQKKQSILIGDSVLTLIGYRKNGSQVVFDLDGDTIKLKRWQAHKCGNVSIKFLGVDKRYGCTSVGIDAPANIKILREELCDV